MKNPSLSSSSANRIRYPLRAVFSSGSALALAHAGCALLGALPGCATQSPLPTSAPAPVATASAQSGAATAAPGGELLGRSTFDGDRTLPWMPLFLEPATGDTLVKDGGFCARVDHPGKNAWDVQLRHREMTIQKGHTYSVRYTVWASAPIRVRAQIGMSGPPYTSYWSDVPAVTTSRQEFTGSFTSHA